MTEQHLKDKLHDDLVAAMRARDARRKSALRMVLTAIQLAEVEIPRPLTDEEIVVLIRKEVKRREEAIEMMRDADRDDLVTEELAELEILQAYLPPLMSEAELRDLAQDAIDEIDAASPRDMGRVMGILMPRVQGRAEGRAVSQVVRDLLSA